eukprot:12123358-Alexandrium_andersonii.AAC.2
MDRIPDVLPEAKRKHMNIVSIRCAGLAPGLCQSINVNASSGSVNSRTYLRRALVAISSNLHPGCTHTHTHWRSALPGRCRGTGAYKYNMSELCHITQDFESASICVFMCS